MRTPDTKPSLDDSALASIYVVTDGANVKIGRSVNPLARLRGLNTGRVEPVTLVAAFDVRRRDAATIEAGLHRTFRRQRISGEWFRVGADVAISEILEVSMKMYGEVRPFNSERLKDKRDDIDFAIERSEAKALAASRWKDGFSERSAARNEKFSRRRQRAKEVHGKRVDAGPSPGAAG